MEHHDGSRDDGLRFSLLPAADHYWFIFETRNRDETFLRAIMPRSIDRDAAVARISRRYAWIGGQTPSELVAIQEACRFQGVSDWRELRLYGPNGLVEYGPWPSACQPETYTPGNALTHSSELDDKEYR